MEYKRGQTRDLNEQSLYNQKKYDAFGLVFSSELYLTNASRIESSHVDITIRFELVPEKLIQPKFVGRNFQAKLGEYLLIIKGVCKILVRNGQDIIIQRCGGSDAEIESELWVSCIAALLIQRGTIALHASVVKLQRGAIIFAGGCGYGKSTILAAFLERNHSLIADDIVAISFVDSLGSIAHSSLLKMYVDADTRTEFNLLAEGEDSPNNTRAPVLVKDLYSSAAVISEIYVLGTTLSNQIISNSLSGVQGFTELARQTYGLEYIEGLCARSTHSLGIGKLASSTNIQQLNIPYGYNNIRDLVRLIECDSLT